LYITLQWLRTVDGVNKFASLDTLAKDNTVS
jgi:hypothetical protein